MKKIVSLIISIMLVSNIAFAQEFDAPASLIMDMNTGRILHKQNETKRMYPASTTKIMTALLVLENLELTDKVTIMEEDFKGVTPYQSPFNIQVGEEITVLDLLYLMLLPSANEAATALARAVSGSTGEFVKLMNTRAKELGAEGTHFANPHGLPEDNHYTTALDLSMISNKALENETFRLIVNTAQKKLQPTNKTPEQRLVYTTNRLIFKSSDPAFYKNAYGVKTGFTNPAGYCLVAFAKKSDDAKILTVVLGAGKDEKTGIPKSFTETKKMFEWVFNNFKNQLLVKKDDNLIEVPIKLSSERDAVVLKAQDSIYAMLETDYDKDLLKTENKLKENIKAPIKEGDILGEAILSYKGEAIGTTNLISVQSASMSKVLYYVDILETFFTTTTFKVIAITVVSLSFLYIFMKITIRKRRKKRRYRNRTMKNNDQWRRK